MKILIDMNLSPEWVPFLNGHGCEASHWSDIGSFRAQDTEIFEWARRENHVIFTNDLDFSRILALTQDKGPSVIQVRTQDLLPENLGPIVFEALEQYGKELQAGALIVIDERSLRIRILPIK
jgi:predicted nuclease of predicted toxin-antitoxin system